MKARYFYAEPAYNTWKKLFVLTEDDILYCEYLDHNAPAKIIRKNTCFSNFKASDYSWGGYQSLVEVDYNTLSNTVLTNQSNWISEYIKIKKKELTTNIDKMESIIENIDKIENKMLQQNEEFINIPGYFMGKKRDIKYIGKRHATGNGIYIDVIFYSGGIHGIPVGYKFEEVMKSITTF